MKPIGQNSSQKAITVGLILVLTLFLEYMGLFIGTDHYLYDLFFRLRGPAETSKKLVILAIDDKTLEKLGRWPFPRKVYTSLLDRLSQAEWVAMDILLAEPSDDDQALGETIRKHGRVVLPLLIDDRMTVTGPVQTLLPVRTGHIHLEPGIDGVVREVYHTLLYKNRFLPSLSSIIYEQVTGKPFQRIPQVPFEGQKTKIVQLDRMHINYCGGPGTLERISLSDLVVGLYPPSYFKNRICLVGLTAPGVAETFQTPFSQDRKGMPGVEIHANILNTLLLHNAITIVPYWIKVLSVLFLTLFSALLFWRITELRAVVLMVLMLPGLTILSYLLLTTSQVWIEPSPFYFIILSLFVISYTFKFMDALVELDKAYHAVRPHLRLSQGQATKNQPIKGIKGLLTPGGLYSKAQVLTGITDQLIFEKKLSDTALLSDIQGVLLFGPDQTLILANHLARVLGRENALPISTLDPFMEGLIPFIADRSDLDRTRARIFAKEYDLSFTVALPLPERKFFKLDGSSLTVAGQPYPLVVLADITKIKELEILKDHLVSLVSHEIKTPLSSIEGFSEILDETLKGEEKEFASIIHKESARLIRFLNTFLDISRLEEGRQPLNLTTVLLSDMVREVALELKALAENQGLTLITEIPAGIGPVRIDSDLTKQCLINLVENAIKYSPPEKSVLIRLSQDAGHLQAQVIDQGIGMSPEVIKRVFEKFYRGPSDEPKPVPGSGLGLTFVKEAMEAQGGTVVAESTYGQGARFSLRFPLEGYPLGPKR